ncbi:MAG: hypothetical protein AB1390_09250 [Nitrospirota bacterium]
MHGKVIEPSNFKRTYMNALIYALILLSLILSCGKKEVKPVSPESKITLEAFELAETLRVAYLENDRKTLEKNSTQNGYRELLGAIKGFDNAELTFTPTWVEIEGGTVYLTVSWKGTWTVKDRVTQDRGAALFVFQGEPLKLDEIKRANPFRQPE